MGPSMALNARIMFASLILSHRNQNQSGSLFYLFSFAFAFFGMRFRWFSLEFCNAFICDLLVNRFAACVRTLRVLTTFGAVKSVGLGKISTKHSCKFIVVVSSSLISSDLLFWGTSMFSRAGCRKAAGAKWRSSKIFLLKGQIPVAGKMLWALSIVAASP